MNVLFRAAQIISPATHIERITVFLASSLKRIDPKEYFCKPFTREHQGILNSEIQKFQDRKPCHIQRIQKIMTRLYGRGQGGASKTYQLKVALHLDFTQKVDPATLTLASLHLLIEDRQEKKAALLFLAQSEDHQNQLYLNMVTGKHAHMLYALGVKFKEGQKQFFLEGALSLFLNARDPTGATCVAKALTQSPENIKELTAAIQRLVKEKISLSVIRKVFEQGNAPSFMIDHIDALRIQDHLKKREFKKATSLAKTLSGEKERNGNIESIIFALTSPQQLAMYPELLIEDPEEKLKSLLSIGMAGRWYTGITVPFTKQIKEAQNLLPLLSNRKIQKKCEEYIKQASAGLLK
jgi:hypothetical protein